MRTCRRSPIRGFCSRLLACGVPKFGAHCEKSPICRQDANFGTPHGIGWQQLPLELSGSINSHNSSETIQGAAIGTSHTDNRFRCLRYYRPGPFLLENNKHLFFTAHATIPARQHSDLTAHADAHSESSSN